jgi:hypothetical protein
MVYAASDDGVRCIGSFRDNLANFVSQKTDDLLCDALFPRKRVRVIIAPPQAPSPADVHSFRYIELAGGHPRLQRTLLRWATGSMRITAWTSYPQKFVPIAFMLYWYVG